MGLCRSCCDHLLDLVSDHEPSGVLLGLALGLESNDCSARINEPQVMLVAVDDRPAVPARGSLTLEDDGHVPATGKDVEAVLVVAPAVGERELVVGRQVALEHLANAIRRLGVVVELYVWVLLYDAVLTKFPSDVTRPIEADAGLEAVALSIELQLLDVVVQCVHEVVALREEPARLANAGQLDVGELAATGRVETRLGAASIAPWADLKPRQVARCEVEDSSEVAKGCSLGCLGVSVDAQQLVHSSL